MGARSHGARSRGLGSRAGEPLGKGCGSGRTCSRWLLAEPSLLLLAPALPPLPGLDGRIGTNFLTTLTKFTGLYVDPWVRALQTGEFRAADRLQLVTMFRYLEFCLEQVGSERRASNARGWGAAPEGRAHYDGPLRRERLKNCRRDPLSPSLHPSSSPFLCPLLISPQRWSRTTSWAP